MLSARKNLFITAMIISCIAPELVMATPTYTSSVRVLGGNPINDPPAPAGNYLVDVAPRSTTSSADLTDKSGTVSFAGADINGDSATMHLHYDGQAQASAAGLKASASITLADALFNASNPLYVLNSRFSVNPDGVPSVFSVLSIARFNDTLSVIADPALSYLRAYLEIDGMTSPRTSAEVAFADVYRADRTPLWRANSFETDHGPTVFSSDFAVVDGKVDFSISLETAVTIYTARMDWSGGATQRDHHSFSNFFNTLTFDSFAGFDLYHNPVKLVSVTGSEGFAYTTVSDGGPVDAPEPMSLALLGLGLAALSLSKSGRLRG